MNMLDGLDASTPKPLFKWLAPAAGLFAAAVVACMGCLLPPPRGLSWTGLIASAAERVLLLFVISAATVSGLCLARPNGDKISSRRLAVRTSLDAVWLAPLALLICEKSVWAMAIAAVLAATATRSFHSLQDLSDKTDAAHPPLSPLTGSAFSLPDLSRWYRQQFSTVCAALCAEAGALAGFVGYPGVAAILVGTSSCVWTWSFTAGGRLRTQETRSAGNSVLRGVLPVGLAIIITVVGLTPYLRNMHNFGGVGVPSKGGSHHGFSSWKGQGEISRAKVSGTSLSQSDFSEAHSGIVLWPEKLTHTTLVAPAPLLGSSLLTSRHSTDPLVIPFNGVYWFFRAPDVRPPKGSREAHGSPEMFNTRSTDRRPLFMEAHQNLGTLIDLDCCSTIQVTIRNADRYPETVSLELILTNVSLPGKPSQSLGSIMVKSTRPWQLYGDRPSVGETLSFRIPGNSAIRRFDEVTIRFHLDPDRGDFGAKIAIERFTLIPQGL